MGICASQADGDLFQTGSGTEGFGSGNREAATEGDLSMGKVSREGREKCSQKCLGRREDLG